MEDSSLSDNAEIVMGQSPPGDTCNSTGNGLPLLNGPTEYGTHHPVPIQFTTDARKRARKGDVLFCVRGSTTGRMNWADREYAIGRGVAAIRHRTRPELQPLVRAVVEYGLPGLLAQATGSTFPNVSADQLARLWWPPLNDKEQHAIAHILDVLDNKIDLNRGMNETLEAMMRTLFKSWFVDFDPVRAKAGGRALGLPKHIADLFPDSFEDSELGKIPKGWVLRTIDELSERVAMGPFGSSIRVETFVATGIPVISGQHLRGTLLDDSEYNFITEEHADQLKRSNVRRGDVIFTHAGSIGQVAFVPDTSRYERYVISQRQFYVRCDPKKMSPLFIVFYFKTPEGQHRLLANTSSTGVPSISQPVSYLRQLQIIVPPEGLLKAFDSIARTLFARVATNKNESADLSALRGSLLPKLISGELRVKNPEKFTERQV